MPQPTRLSSHVPPFRVPFGTATRRHEAVLANVQRYAALRYGLTLAVVAIAASLSSRLFQLYGADTLFFLLGAVIFAAWMGGTGPGLLATALSASAAAYYLMPPLHTI